MKITDALSRFTYHCPVDTMLPHPVECGAITKHLDSLPPHPPGDALTTSTQPASIRYNSTRGGIHRLRIPSAAAPVSSPGLFYYPPQLSLPRSPPAAASVSHESAAPTDAVSNTTSPSFRMRFVRYYDKKVLYYSNRLCIFRLILDNENGSIHARPEAPPPTDFSCLRV